LNKAYFSFRSEDRQSIINAYVFYPEGEIKAVLQIAHGMKEYFLRYEEFVHFLVKKGIAVCGNDHLGHGNINPRLKGYTGGRQGYFVMASDMHFVYDHVSQMFPEKPYFLMGHSMGSFLSRLYAKKWGYELTGLILSGTGNADILTKLLYRAMIFYSAVMVAVKGPYTPAHDLERLSQNMFNKRFKPLKTTADWQTSNTLKAEEFIKDPLCSFEFTYGAYRDLLSLIVMVSKKGFGKFLPKNMPVLLFSGRKDPVGTFGLGVYEVFRDFRRAGLKDVTMKLYKDGRHEMLNEVNYKEVYEYVYQWITDRIGA